MCVCVFWATLASVCVWPQIGNCLLAGWPQMQLQEESDDHQIRVLKCHLTFCSSGSNWPGWQTSKQNLSNNGNHKAMILIIIDHHWECFEDGSDIGDGESFLV